MPKINPNQDYYEITEINIIDKLRGQFQPRDWEITVLACLEKEIDLKIKKAL